MQQSHTGPIDEYYGFQFGRLKYRSLEFRFETHDVPFFQPAAVVNYPNEYDFTRITEFKHITGQAHRKTTIAYEYPRDNGEPFYPMVGHQYLETYRKYELLSYSKADISNFRVFMLL